MIFVTVGTHTQSFNRLLKEVDKLKAVKKIKERTVAQIGHSTYEPKKIQWFRFTTFEKLNKLYRNSRIIISHGGAGSILNGLSNRKPVIVVPRLKKFNEHVNDHQLDLVKELDKNGKIIAVYDIEDLQNALLKARNFGKVKTENKICNEIEKFLKAQKKTIR